MGCAASVPADTPVTPSGELAKASKRKSAADRRMSMDIRAAEELANSELSKRAKEEAGANGAEDTVTKVMNDEAATKVQAIARGNKARAAAGGANKAASESTAAAEPEAPTEAADGATGKALVDAVAADDVELVNKLIADGADVEWPSADVAFGGGTALMLAAVNGSEACLNALIAAKANVNAQSNPGLTALIDATRVGKLNTVEILLKADGVDKELHNKHGVNPLLACCKYNQPEAAKVLLAAGCNKEFIAPEGSFAGLNPLTFAAQEGHVEVVKIFLEAGCDKAATANGKTALEIATEKGHAEVVALLGGGEAPAEGETASTEAADTAS